MTTATVATPEKKGIPGFAQLQRIGRALMLPIASLPAAALLLRLGQPDMLGADGLGKHLSWLNPVAEVMAAAGNALFANLAMLFAVGVAVGYARKSDGSTALAAVIGYFVFKGVGDAMSPHILGKPKGTDPQALIDWGVFGGIIIGIIAALLWQKYYRIKLPQALAFFGGRRFVPIVTALAAIVASVLMSFIYKPFNTGLTNFGEWTTHNEVLGGFVYGTANRLLVPIGLHHLLNAFPWFQLGSYTGSDGVVYHGDIARFLHGDPTAGAFMTGFFPIMMFALPAAALAIIHTAKPQNRAVVAGIMGSAALVSFVTGVTEPLEFSFVYVAYPLYAIHAVLTGTSLALVNALGIKDGFGFSAGGIDYLLNFNIATKPLLLIPIGLGYAVIYYVIFRWAITKFKMKTPGREEDDETGRDSVLVDQPAETGAASADPATRDAVDAVVDRPDNIRHAAAPPTDAPPAENPPKA
ncbi:PTS transporter subunit EIIC [Luteimicrobium subarcticum]|uniref:PTS system N-acetylglucosamine-specific IIC component (Glc family) n=1 Tax=Luteimicrobium subarcticum TaxID=620910 RepID=A0A2M8W7B2_9MICO|nr:PTS transporter subunit EIIC [Luteimicrobium subarcticum]PJI86782.1 PTS system N-acetylglucosamine-specific IIC component (Glc family) [Luteimicrobium subarcticum]